MFEKNRFSNSFASHWKHQNQSLRTFTKAFGLYFMVSVSFICPRSMICLNLYNKIIFIVGSWSCGSLWSNYINHSYCFDNCCSSFSHIYIWYYRITNIFSVQCRSTTNASRCGRIKAYKWTSSIDWMKKNVKKSNLFHQSSQRKFPIS